jgi:hypothetical protein
MSPRAGDPFADLQAMSFPALALSAYLAAGAGAAFDPGYHHAALKELARQTEAVLGEAELAALRRELPEALAYLDLLHPPPGLALGLFCCSPAGLLRLWRLPPEIETELRIGSRLHLAPVRRLLQLHPPALVVVADKERVRIFTSVLTEVEELAEEVGEPVDRHRQGGWSATSYQRREDLHARSNLKVAGELLSRADRNFFQRIYLAGPPEARAELRRLLPRDAARRVAGELHLPTYLATAELAHRLRELLSELEAPPA